MNEEKLKEVINYNDEYESKLALPNELFMQIQTMVSQGKLKPTHCGFVWSYVYFMTYLFRYCKWNEFQPTSSEIKSILGYTSTNKTLDYIIKKNGLLEQEGLLTTIEDFPILYEYDELDKALFFTFAGELEGLDYFREQRNLSKRVTCKYPEFAFPSEEYDGTFYNSECTTIVEFDVFARCMSDKELGVNAFYIYSWLKHKNDLHSDYKTTRKRLAKELHLSEGTLHKYFDTMRSYRIVDVIYNMEYFSKGWEQHERESSTYKVNPYNQFTDVKVSYGKLKFMSEQQHEELLKVDDIELFT